MISEVPAAVPQTGLLEAARRVGLRAIGAQTDDAEIDFPHKGVRDLYEAGLLLAPFPASKGGQSFGVTPESRLALLNVLVEIGFGNLSLGRLYEGHVNAVLLVERYGNAANLRLLHQEAKNGHLTGVWMAEADRPLRLLLLEGQARLVGAKVLCSGAGHIRRPLVAAGQDQGGTIMVLPLVDDASRCRTDEWTPTGMRATATGSVDFEGIAIKPEEIVGKADDYLRSPIFRGGAWRVLAVQLGGLIALKEAYRLQLAASGHADNAIQRARFGEATFYVETARLWVRQACITSQGDDDPDAVDAYVDLARNAFEQAVLRTVALAQKSIGLKSFLRPNPIERISRDLTTYLRQPGLDLSLDSAAGFYLSRPHPRVIA